MFDHLLKILENKLVLGSETRPPLPLRCSLTAEESMRRAAINSMVGVKRGKCIGKDVKVKV